jgi:hypothetical protein
VGRAEVSFVHGSADAVGKQQKHSEILKSQRRGLLLYSRCRIEVANGKSATFCQSKQEGIMRKLASLIGTVALAVGLGTGSSWGFGFFAYVDAENGTDSATCGGSSLANPSTGPCASLDAALGTVNSGGTIFIIKGGEFPPIYLTAPVSIIGPEDRSAVIEWANIQPGCIGGAQGSCNGHANAVYAVDVEAGPGNSVKLKNVTIHNNTGTSAALHVGAAANVSMTNVSLRAGSVSPPQLMLVDSSQGSQLQLYFNRVDAAFNSSGGAISISPSGNTPVSANINNSEIHNAAFGIQVVATSLTGGATIAMAIDDTQFFSFNNSAVNIAAPALGDGASVRFVRSNIINTGGAALKINGAGASASLYETVITHNSAGVNLVNSGTGSSYQNNQISNNGTNCEVSGASTPCSTALASQSQN